MIGDWKDHWEQLQQALERLEAAYAGREGGSAIARNDLATLFERSESLRDWTKKAIGSAKPHSVDLGMKRSIPLSLAHDIAIKLKHQVQSEKPWSGATDADVDSQSVNVRVETINVKSTVGGQSTVAEPSAPTTAAHSWTISYTPSGASKTTVDALDLARDVVAEWKLLLEHLGLL